MAAIADGKEHAAPTGAWRQELTSSGRYKGEEWKPRHLPNARLDTPIPRAYAKRPAPEFAGTQEPSGPTPGKK